MKQGYWGQNGLKMSDTAVNVTSAKTLDGEWKGTNKVGHTTEFRDFWMLWKEEEQQRNDKY